MDRNDLRRAVDFAGAAIAARTEADVGALVRRVRQVVRADEVHLQRIAVGGVAEWCDPDGIRAPCRDDQDHDECRITLSEPTSFGLVHLSAWRGYAAFGPRDHVLLSLISPYLTAAVVAAHRHGVRAQAVNPESTLGTELTSREVEILALIAEGATNKEVAHDLEISPRTVQKHLEHIYGKLGLHRRTAAGWWWAEHLAAG